MARAGLQQGVCSRAYAQACGPGKPGRPVQGQARRRGARRHPLITWRRLGGRGLLPGRRQHQLAHAGPRRSAARHMLPAWGEPREEVPQAAAHSGKVSVHCAPRHLRWVWAWWWNGGRQARSCMFLRLMHGAGSRLPARVAAHLPHCAARRLRRLHPVELQPSKALARAAAPAGQLHGQQAAAGRERLLTSWSCTSCGRPHRKTSTLSPSASGISCPGEVASVGSGGEGGRRRDAELSSSWSAALRVLRPMHAELDIVSAVIATHE
jgi:hypothetical protein